MSDTPMPYHSNLIVKQGGAVIPNASGDYEFEEVVLLDGDDGYTSTDVVFTVENTGDETLVIDEVTLVAGDAADFDLDLSGLNYSVAPSLNSTFTIRFDPIATLGVRSTAVSIKSNDTDEPTYTFSLNGYGLRKCVATGGTTDLSMNESTLVVGAVGSESAYIYYRDYGGSNNWGEVKKLTASDGIAGDRFGQGVAISGDIIIVGASEADKVYVFYRDQGGPDNWGEVKIITGSDVASGDWFGSRISLDDDTLVVGALYHNSQQGCAYVFYRGQGGPDNWGEVKKLTASDGATGDRFGLPVSISGDTIFIGAHDHAVGSSINQGCAYVFYRNHEGPDNWGEVKKLIASNGKADDDFGTSGAISGDTIAVGAIGAESAYVYYRNHGGANNWGEVTRLIAKQGTSGDLFGTFIAANGDTIVVGAQKVRVDFPIEAQGAAYVFSRNAGGMDNWGELKRLTASDRAFGDYFGSDLAVFADIIAVGSYSDSVYIYKQ